MIDGIQGSAQENPRTAAPTGEPYRVLALETRPQTLSALVGQETVRKVLGDLIANHRVPHALLFTGTRGTGKTSTARIFAKALCCISGPTSEPCGTCVHCMGITASAHEDVLEIDGASNTGVDQIRELRESARFYPKSARYKVFIIDEVHMLSIGAFNALLKTLEEPPDQVIFILATTEINKVPSTVKSRCMILPFRKVDVSTLSNHLESVLRLRRLTAEPEALVLVAREARGSFRDGLSLIEQAIPYAENGHISKRSIEEAFGLQDADIAQTIFRAIVTRDSRIGLLALHDADNKGFDFSRILQQTSELFRHALVLKTCKDFKTPDTDQSQDSVKSTVAELRSSTSAESEFEILVEGLLESERNQIIALTSNLSASALTESFRILQQGVQDVSRSSLQRPWAEIALLDCIDRSEWLDTRVILEALSQALPSPAQAITPTQGNVLSQAKHAPQAQFQAVNPNEHHLNLGKLKEWIRVVSENAVPLGAKLRHAQFERFSEKEVRLANKTENKIFGSVSASDQDIMLQALQAIGFANAKLFGFTVQSAPIDTSASAPETADTEKKKPLVQVERNSFPKPSAQNMKTPDFRAGTTAQERGKAHKAFQQSNTRREFSDPFASQPFDAPPVKKVLLETSLQREKSKPENSGHQTHRSEITSSISGIETREANQAFEAKKKRVLAHPFFVKLNEAADRLEISLSKSD